VTQSSDNLPASRDSFATGLSADRATGVAGDYAGPPTPDDGSGLDVRRYIAAVLRYKWLVLAVLLIGTAAGVAASRFVKPTYVSEATILVPERVQGARSGPIQPDVLFQTFGWVELIKTSYIVLDDVVRNLRLYVHPGAPEDSAAFGTFGLKDRFRPGRYELKVSGDGRAFELSMTGGQLVDRGAVGDSIGAGAGFAWVPPDGSLRSGRTVSFSVLPPRDVARQIQQEVQARINERGASMLAIRLEGTDPVRLAATVNSIADGFVDTARALSLSKHRELIRTLRLQLDSADRRLRDAEIAFEQYRVGTYTLPRERATPIAPGVEGTTNPALDNYTQMKFRLDELERDRETLEAALVTAGDSGLSGDQLGYIGSVQESSELSANLKALTEKQAELTGLRLRYTEQNPEVQRATRDLAELRTRTIPDLVRGLMAQISSREREIEGRIAAAGRELQQVPRRATEEQRLRRQVDLAEFQYQNLERQYQDALYAQAAEELGARVLDAAVVPSRPLKDTAMRLIGMALLGSLGLGLLAAILLDRLDRRVRYPDQVSRDLGLPIIGAVPRVKLSGNGLGMKHGETVQVVEALRGIRMGLIHAHGVAGPMMFTITSPGPGEGKSFVASNLALAFADAGHRTLLIDGDVRRGELHRLLDAQRKPGLTDYLEGTTPREAVLQRTRYPSLTFLGGGTRTHGAPELLSSPALGQLLLSLRSTYDVILVDTPPLGAGVDPYVLATATGNLVLVMRTGVTDRELAGAKLDMLDRLPIRILGAILNDVQPGAAYRYYGYHHYYLEGYETREEGQEGQEGQGRTLPRASRAG
jgi:capsular exopolysaccharide synthesis family protein